MSDHRTYDEIRAAAGPCRYCPRSLVTGPHCDSATQCVFGRGDHQQSSTSYLGSLVPQTVTMAPAAIQSRRSGHHRHKTSHKPTASMLRYRDALWSVQPATDHRVSSVSRLPLASVNARRADWLIFDPTCIEAVGRVREGYRVTRTLWQIRPGSIAETATS